MISMFAFLDFIQCILWVSAYVLILYSTIKNKYPAIAPLAQAVVFPWEFVALIQDICRGYDLNYVVIMHILWVVVEATIIIYVLFVLKYYDNRKTIIYCILIIALIIIMFLIFKLPNGMMYTSYGNAFVGMTIWFIYIGNSDYPRKKNTLIIFITKLMADIFGCMAYYNFDIFIFGISLALPVLDSLFIIRFFNKRKTHREKYNYVDCS